MIPFLPPHPLTREVTYISKCCFSAFYCTILTKKHNMGMGCAYEREGYTSWFDSPHLGSPVEGSKLKAQSYPLASFAMLTEYVLNCNGGG